MGNKKTTDITFFSVAAYGDNDTTTELQKARLNAKLIETQNGFPLFYDKFTATQAASELLPLALGQDKLVSLVTITESYEREWLPGRNFNQFVETLLPQEVSKNEFINLTQVSSELRDVILLIIEQGLIANNNIDLARSFARCETNDEYIKSLSVYPFVVDILKANEFFQHVKAFQVPYKTNESDGRRVVVYELKDPVIDCYMDSDVLVTLPPQLQVKSPTDNLNTEPKL
ncbi:hypothetical protein PULV_a3905 [Pseudoalteromonas ulvae UL12]|uniref:hypothetical protein n=1 Tax=Pseudoalteromonas ulvae TaxID=107327 RepID=UPI00186B626A|nr:hypothetical protein [Pseudoalteromonas ulvae]MBE0362106.1 hypothetical protein [Pseudoalteromonas ulvae UL12]